MSLIHRASVLALGHMFLALLVLSTFVQTHIIHRHTNGKSHKYEPKLYSNNYVLKIDENYLNEVGVLLEQNNFKIIRKIGLLKGFYLVRSQHDHVINTTSDLKELDDVLKSAVQKIKSNELVESFQNDKIVTRGKRDLVVLNKDLSSRRSVMSMFNDQYWDEMWYLNRHSLNITLPDMNVTGAWAQGYSGRGVSISFLDDGLEWQNPDIRSNYDPLASYDYNEDDHDPSPRYEETNENKHGTRCAGVVAAVADNDVCSVGIAFNSKIGGIKILDGSITDSNEASALNLNSDHVSIYSSSWGPTDNGQIVDGPGPLALNALKQGIEKGRKGLGSLYVWAAGNGGSYGDSCACDGFINSIYTFSVSSVLEHNEKPWYSEACTSILTTTYGGRNQAGIITTDIRNSCTTSFTGTSASAPMAVAIMALALEANPNLTWRDVMFLVVLTSRSKVFSPESFITNKIGLLVSSIYGFGLMDAGRMTELAKTWKTVPPLKSCSVNHNGFNISTTKTKKSITSILKTNACQGTYNEVNYIEQVQIIVTIKIKKRGSLEIYLTSPMGTESKILSRREKDESEDGFKNWSFMTVQLWGENPRGEWKLVVSSTDNSTVEMEPFNIIIHGTKEEPIDYKHYLNV